MIGLAWRKQSTPHGNAAIDRDLDQHRADFVRRHAVVERAAHVGLEFLHAAERGDHAEVEDRALARRQRVVAPGLAPAILRDDALEVAVEVVDVRHRLVDVFVAGDLAAHLHADVVGFLVHDVSSALLSSPRGEGRERVSLEARVLGRFARSPPRGEQKVQSSAGPPSQRFTSLVSMPNRSSRRPTVWLMMSSTVFGLL